MPKPALIYAWTVVAIGAILAAASGLLWQTTNAPAFGLCLGLAVLASTFKVKLPGFDGTISPAFVFQLVAAAQFTGPEMVAIGMAAALVQCLWKHRNKFSFVKVAFNVSTVAISSGLAYALAHQTPAETGHVAQTLMLGVAGLVLLVVNTMMVSVVVCLLRNTPIHTAWRSLQFWAFPYYLAGGILASVWVHIVTRPSATLAVLAAISVYLLSVCYRETMQRVNRLGEAQA